MLKRVVSSGILLTTALAMAQEDYYDWSYIKELTVNTTETGTHLTEGVGKYPLLVRLGPGEADVFTQAGANGASLRFTTPNLLTRLPHSIDHWDVANQSAAIWVLVDSVSANNAKGVDIRMLWGKADAADSSKASSVFTKDNGFLAVFPMGGDATTPRPNAVAGRNPATPHNLPEEYAATTGVIGAADTLGETGGNALAAEHFSFGPITAEDMPTSNLTMSVWLKASSGLNPYAHVLTLAGEGVDKQNNIYIAKIDWKGGGNITFAAVAAGNGDEIGPTGPAWTHESWQLIHAVLDGGTRRLYNNGAQVGITENAAEPAIMNRANALIGATTWPDNSFAGAYDEVRVANVSRSAAWVALDYATQMPGATTLALGTSGNVPEKPAGIADLRYESGNTDAIDTLRTTAFANMNVVPTYVGIADSFTVSASLPAGLSLNKTTGAITGAANASSNVAVLVTAHAGNETATRTVRLIVASGIANLRYVTTNTASRDTLRMETGVAVNLVPTYLGGPADSIKVTGSNTSIPGGLSINKTTGAITGTPTAAFTGNRTITAYFGNLTTTRDIRFVVTLGPPSVTYHPKDTLSATVGASFTAAPIASGRAITKWTAVTALPAGLQLDSLNGAISGVPTAAAAAANYTLRGTNATDTLNKVIRLTVAAAVAGGEYKEDWSGHRRIKLNTSSTGANVAGTVVNVPVLVRFDSTQSAVFTSAGTNGASLRFTKTDGTTLLKHEVDHWDATAKKGAVWVLVDTVKGNQANQEIWMHFGNATATSVSNAHGVFSEANGFLSVFHLGAGTNASPRLNAVAGRNPAYPFNLPSTHASHTGVIGLADSLGGSGAGANAQHFSFGPFPAGSFTNQQGTLSLWLKPSSPFNGYASHAISLGSGTPNNNFWVGRFGGETVASIAGSSGDATSEGDRYVGPDDATDGWEQGAWQLVHFSLNVPDVNIYKNGRLIGSAANQKLPDGVRTSAYIGRALWSADALIAGIYDEVRVANVARSADWVKLEYENQKESQTLVTIDTLSFPGTGIANALLSGPALSYRTMQDGVLFNIRTNTAAKARIEILDMRGRAVWTRSLQATAGVNEVLWNGTERNAGSGIYFVRMLLLDANNKPTHTLERKLPLAR